MRTAHFSGNPGGGCLPPGGVSASGGVCLGGIVSMGGLPVTCDACSEANPPPPPTYEQNDRQA